MQTATYKVDGMTCGGCVASVKRALNKKLPGVDVDVTLADGRVTITGDHQAQAVKDAVEKAGFGFQGLA